MTAASWFHSSMKTVSRSQGRSAVAAAAYRLGEKMQDERYGLTHDYPRKRGVEAAFTLAPQDAPEWAHDPEQLWNAAEAKENRSNSVVARETELALPGFLGAEERRSIAVEFAEGLVERYGVAVSVAIHAPGREGDQRNYHAHVLYTTREMTAEGLGAKTRILDAKATRGAEVIKLRELAADIINRHLAAAHSDIRVDHRSFEERGIDQEPTTHLGPAATAMERRGMPSDRGDINRQVQKGNAALESSKAELAQVRESIEERKQELAAPPVSREEAQERFTLAAERSASMLREALRQRRERTLEPMPWAQRVLDMLRRGARKLGTLLKSEHGERMRERWKPEPEAWRTHLHQPAQEPESWQERTRERQREKEREIDL